MAEQDDPGLGDAEARDDDPDTAPLAGVLVADLSRVLAAPLATMQLADLGAQVIKVERPGTGDDTRTWGPPWRDMPDGGRESTYHLAVNRDKRSVTLDLGDAHDRGLARALCARADVVVENFRPGGAARLGLSYQEVAADNPRVVYASITGFGTAPQAAGLGGYDLLVQAMSGLMHVTGDAEGPPRKVGVAVVDVLTGLFTTNGILAALYERERSGRGQHVEVSLLGSALAGLVNQTSAVLAGGAMPTRMGDAHPSVVPYATYAAADGPVVIAVGSDRLFSTLCRALGVPRLADDPRFATNGDRVAHREALADALEERLHDRPAADWVADLRARGIPAGAVNDVGAALAEATALGLDPVVELSRNDGDVIAGVRNPIDLSRTPLRHRSAPPHLGQHDAEVRRWLEDPSPPTT